MAKYKRKTSKDKQKEIEKLADDFSSKIDSYFESEENFKEHLKVMSEFHNYSVRNMTLIDNQFRGANAVGSYNFWKSKGANVKKGEKAIKILAPNPITYFPRKTGNDEKMTPIKYANKEEKAKIRSGELITVQKMYFKVGSVFEYTQTNAREKEIELSKIFNNFHRDGSIENDKEIFNSLEKVADNLGVNILDEPKEELGTAKGASYPYTKEIALNPRNTDYEDVTVLIHELAHAKLHTPENRLELTTSEKEFQAELIAFVVSNRYGVDTEEFSLSYLNGWTKGKELKDKEKLLNEVKETSKEFIDTIDTNLLEIENEKSVSMSKNKINIKGFENGSVIDEYELASMVITNGTTGKEHEFSVWHTIDDLMEKEITLEDIQDSELYVVMHNPSDFYDDELEHNLDDYALRDMFSNSDEIEKTIADYYSGKTEDFNLEIPEDKHLFNLEETLFETELSDIFIKSDMDILNETDIINFGKTTENIDFNDFNEIPNEISDNFRKVINDGNIKENDLQYVNTAFEKLNIDKEEDWTNENEYGVELQQEGFNIDGLSLEMIKEIRNKEESENKTQITSQEDIYNFINKYNEKNNKDTEKTNNDNEMSM